MDATVSKMHCMVWDKEETAWNKLHGIQVDRKKGPQFALTWNLNDSCERSSRLNVRNTDKLL